MNCRKCNSIDTRVVAVTRKPRETWRYCKCLKCNARFKTIETYAVNKPIGSTYTMLHPNHVKRGEDNGSSVLTENNIRQIRELAKQNVKYTEIAIKFGIHLSSVYRIVKRKAWAHVA